MKIDVSSTMVEKGLDLAKDFLNKLIGPTVEEIGLLAKDQVTLWKLKNQIKILNKTKAYCEKNNVSIKTISLKLLCPLLENAALEEDEVLQDKWANLLANMVDSDQNVDNHVFPYLLSQLSTSEFKVLVHTLGAKNTRISGLLQEVSELEVQYNNFINKSKNERIELTKEIELRKRNNIANPMNYTSYHNLQTDLKKIDFTKELMNRRLNELREMLRQQEKIDERLLKSYEISNLTRLGIIKAIPVSFLNAEPLDIPNNHTSDTIRVDLDIELLSDFDDHILTALGELFIIACMEKKTVTTI